MKRKTSSRIAQWILIGILIITMFPTFFSQNVIAQGDDALMGEISITAEPDSQGAGGPITIVVDIPFYGGCCYPLWAYEVSASLNLPEYVSLAEGPIPAKYDEIEAKAGGEADYYYFKWTVKSMVPGRYNVSVTVTTENCGIAEGIVGFAITEGCVMSIPEIYPELAPTNREINLKLEAMSPIEGITIENVNLFYFIGNEELNIAKTKNEVILYEGGGSDTGKYIPMNRNENEDYLWETVIPGQSSTCYLYYWVVATDSQGNITTSPAYSLKIEDLDQASLMVNLAFWLSILFTIIGLLIIVVSIMILKRRALERNKDGVHIIGSEEGPSYGSETDQDTLWRKKKKRIRAIAFIALIIITAIFIVWTITSNLYDDLIYIVEGGI